MIGFGCSLFVIGIAITTIFVMKFDGSRSHLSEKEGEYFNEQK